MLYVYGRWCFVGIAAYNMFILYALQHSQTVLLQIGL